MEPMLLAGDYITVNKWITGARIFNLRKALNGADVDVYRLPGLGKIKRNDVLVFNYPYPKKKDSISMDVMLYYVKRCIALPGDTIEIKNGFYKVRGNQLPLGNMEGQMLLRHIVKPVEHWTEKGVYPQDSMMKWTLLEFGPLYIPRRNALIKMNTVHGILYKNLIEWEQKRKLIRCGNEILLGDSVIHYYRFQENYYFVAGDRVTNSDDSRYWGLLPETYIVGKATFIWKSVDLLTGEIRWGRIGKGLGNFHQ